MTGTVSLNWTTLNVSCWQKVYPSFLPAMYKSIIPAFPLIQSISREGINRNVSFSVGGGGGAENARRQMKLLMSSLKSTRRKSLVQSQSKQTKSGAVASIMEARSPAVAHFIIWFPLHSPFLPFHHTQLQSPAPFQPFGQTNGAALKSHSTAQYLQSTACAPQ